MADGYEPSWEEAQQMEREHAERLAAQGYTRALDDLNAQAAWNAAQAVAQIQETQAAAQQAQARADSLAGSPAQQAAQDVANELSNQAAVQQVQYAYSQNPEAYSAPYTGSTGAMSNTAGLLGGDPNWAGTPTLYRDSSGNIKGVYTSAGVVPVESLNPLVAPGQQITANTFVQAVNNEGQKLYLRDKNDPNSVTTTNTGIPAIGGTVAEQGFVPQKGGGVLGTIGSDFAGMAKDPAFWKFLASSAAILGGGLAANAAFGAPALEGAVATAFPVEMGGLLPATELGAAGTAGATAGGMSAAEALALASEGGLGAEFGVQGALAANPGLMASLEAMLPAGAAGTLIKGGLTLGGLAALSALAPKQSSGGSTSQPGLSAAQLQSIVSQMPSAMGNYISLAGNPYGYGGGTPYSANANLAELFPNFSLPTTGPYFGAGRFSDAYAPVAAPTAPISPTGLV